MTQVTDEDRALGAAFLTTLGFPQFAKLVDGSLNILDSGGEQALELIARHREAAFNAGLERAAGIAGTWDGPRVSASKMRGVIATAIRAAKDPSNG